MKKLLFILLLLCLSVNAFGAVSFSYTDNGSYHTLATSGSGNFSDDDAYQYLKALEVTDGEPEGTYMTRTGSAGSYVYTLKVQGAEDYVRTIVNSGEVWQREEGATWGQEMREGYTSSLYTIYITSGAGLELAPNCVFDGSINNPTQGYAYFYFYGYITGTQSLGNEAIFQNMRSCYFTMNSADVTPYDIDYLIIRNSTYSTGYMAYFSGAATSGWDGSNSACSFKHITISDDGGNGDNFHIIEVSKDGYEFDTREISMTEDRDITVTLTANDTTTKLIDSTVIDSIIY